MNIDKVVKAIETIAPLELGESWDNSGIQILLKDDIKKIMVCLELNDEVISEAINENVDLVITHHPLLFNKPSSIDFRDVLGRYVIKLIENNISVYSSHIPFDNSLTGNNFDLANRIGLDNIERTMELNISHPGVIGEFGGEGIKLGQVLDIISKAIDIPMSQLRVVGDLEKNIKKVGICTGSGFGLMYDSLGRCDLYISGEVKLNQAQDAKAMGIALVDAGHYYTENIFVENMTKQLLKLLDNEVLVVGANSSTNPFTII